MERFESMPDGWRIDNTWGSPEFGWQPICNGKSLLNGGKKGLLRIQTNKQLELSFVYSSTPQKGSINKEQESNKPSLSKDDIRSAALPLNLLARAKLKEKLMQDLLVDLTVCKLEGWDTTEYVNELKQLIDDICQRIAKTPPSSGS